MRIGTRARLLATAMAFAGSTQAAMAQTPPADATAADAQQAPDTGADIVVTGSILRQQVTASPVTTLTTDALDSRGVDTVQDALQMLASNNGPALVNSFTASGAFAAGASGISLRGLSTNSTLVLFDGMRAAYYPLSDDGSRNFVDLNTIPDDIVDRVEVLRDGASSSYGADAIAGVVNIITKREFKGIGARAEAGVSQDGVGATQRLTLTVGNGDLAADGYNAYLSGFYYRSARVMNHDLPPPFNSSDQRRICFQGTCGPNNVAQGLNSNGQFTGAFPNPTLPSDFYVRPYDATNTTPQGRYQLLNPARGCQYGPAYALTAADQAANADNPLIACQEDNINRYGTVSPQIERFGASARFTARIGGSTEAFMLFNFQQSSTDFTGAPAGIRATANTGIRYARFSTSSSQGAVAPGSAALTLPVWVCPERINCAASPNRRLNPNNPFAAQNQVARITGRLGDTLTDNATRSRVYRAAAGITGPVFGDGTYRVDATAMHNDLRLTTNGFVYIQHLLDVVADGSYNFVNPSQNSAAVRDYLSPENRTNDSSDLYELQATLGKPVLELPGGALELGLGASIRYEAVDAPSANDDYNGPTQRYFVLNAFGTAGHRTVYSAFGEVDAPILDLLDVNASGRYDHYSSGQSAFSPKIGVKFTPVRQVTVRGTYSRGFRIPSFAEANALPTTGFVPLNLPGLPDSFLQQYGAGCTHTTSTTGCPTYLRGAAVGQTTLATPDLKPEKSRSFTAGVLFKPIRNVTLTVDYYNIKKTGAITSASVAPALAAYFAGQPIPAGFTIIPDAPDPNFPNARPRIAFIESHLVNADTIQSEGLDFSATGSFALGAGVTFTTSLEASYILNLSTTFADGTTESYEGTLGNFILTAGSGTPRWHGNWQNTLEVEPFSLTAGVNYFGGYNLSAEDQEQPGASGDCGLSPGYTPCNVRRFITVDAVGSVKVGDGFTFYLDVLNLLDTRPPIDPVTYGAFLYNPVQGGMGILGRQFRAGVKMHF
ncbi:MAG: TonB-dependent receptor [Sphingomonas sp.]